MSELPMSEFLALGRPGVFWIGLAIATVMLLGWWRHALRRRRLAEFLGGARAVDRLSRSDLYRRRLERAFLLGFVGIALSLAAADIHWADAPPEPPPPPPKNVVLALDVSASMQATDVAETRLARAADVARTIVDSVPDARIGVLLFAGTSYPLALPTLDHDAVRFLLDGITPTIATALDPGTLISVGIESSLELLDRADGLTEPDTVARPLSDVLVPDELASDVFAFEGPAGDRVSGGERHIVLIGDGESAEPDIRVQQVVALAREAEVTVHAVGVGTQTGSGMVMPSGTYQLGGRIVDQNGNDAISRLNEPVLRQAAAVGGGAYARGDDAEEMAALRDALRAPPESSDPGPDPSAPPWTRYDLAFVLGALALALISLEALLDVAPFRDRRKVVPRPRIPGTDALATKGRP